MTQPSYAELHTVHNEARADYLATHPEPDELDFPCARCGADPGAGCTGRGAAPTKSELRLVAALGIEIPPRYHAPRVDLRCGAFMQRGSEATAAGEAAVNALLKEARS
jgi:hypothetical protein